jgi:Flp pilus assembly protein TadD
MGRGLGPLDHARIGLAAALAGLLGLSCPGDRGRGEPPTASTAGSPSAASAAAPATEGAATFAGGARCAACHAAEAAAWRGSHHDLAMQEASDETVLAPFAGETVASGPGDSTFFRRDGRFLVRTAGRDGRTGEHEVRFAFGVDPLQQYLVPFPDGRVQALGVAWDARPSAVGGQRWLHLFPDAAPGTPLHWTGIDQTWNHMCAECHSTNLAKNYRPDADRYDTTWSELDVSCEACHGPGSRHVAWAEAAAGAVEPDAAGRTREAMAARSVEAVGPGHDVGLAVRFPLRGEWAFAPGAPIAQRAGPPPGDAELDACGRCHARRGTITSAYEHGRPLLDTHRPALLDEGLYHADGQIRDEVYEWGSFLQSRMHAAGVRCSDCHDPHALAIPEPDAACARCHRPEVFAVPAHHRHAEGSPGASCVACHMPARVYMQVDSRRDHSIRVPRPDLTASIGTPNACGDCHADRTAAWVAQALRRWFPDGRSGTPHYGEALHAGRAGRAGAPAALRALVTDRAQPGIVRASALRLLGTSAGPPPTDAVAAGAGDTDALVRLAAAGAAEALEPRVRLRLVQPLLRDPVRAVRLEAASALLDVPASWWPPAGRPAFADALAEYRSAQEGNADRPEGRMSLGLLHLWMGEADAARAEYSAARRLDPSFTPAAVNLADLLRATGDEARAEQVLRDALAADPGSAAARHALGLALVRQGRRSEALAELARAVELAPDDARHATVYAVALHGAGRVPEALAVLAATHERRPLDRDVLVTLATLQRDAGDRAAALRHARALLALAPDDPAARALVEELESPGGASR